MAAFCLTSASVPMATVKTLGTATRMFSKESASLSGMSIWIGSRARYAYSWMTGQTKAARPECSHPRQLLRDGVGYDVDRIRPDDVHDEDRRTRRQRALRRHRLVLD